MLAFTGFRRAAAAVMSLILVLCLAAGTAGAVSYSLQGTLGGAAVDVKLSFDPESLMLGLSGSVSAEGDAGLSGGLYAGARGLILDSPLIGGAYGIDLTRVAENLPGSVFAPDSGSSFALPQNVYDTLLDVLNGRFVMPDTITVPGVGTIDTTVFPALLPHLGAGVNAAMRGLQTQSGPITLQVREQSLDAYRTAFTLTSKEVAAALCAVLDSLSADTETLGKLDSLYDLAVAAGLSVRTTDTTLSAFLAENSEALQRVLTTAMLASPATCTLSLYLNPDDRAILGGELDFHTETSKTVLRIVSVDNILVETLETEDTCISVEMGTEPRSGNAFRFFEYVTANDQELLRTDVDVDPDAGTFTAVSTLGGRTNTVTGTVEQPAESVVTVTLRDFNGNPVDPLVFTVNGNDPVPVPEFTDLLTLSEQELSRLCGFAMQLLSSVNGR